MTSFMSPKTLWKYNFLLRTSQCVAFSSGVHYRVIYMIMLFSNLESILQKIISTKLPSKLVSKAIPNRRAWHPYVLLINTNNLEPQQSLRQVCLPLFALHYLSSLQCYLKTLYLLGNQDKEIIPWKLLTFTKTRNRKTKRNKRNHRNDQNKTNETKRT